MRTRKPKPDNIDIASNSDNEIDPIHGIVIKPGDTISIIHPTRYFKEEVTVVRIIPPDIDRSTENKHICIPKLRFQTHFEVQYPNSEVKCIGTDEVYMPSNERNYITVIATGNNESILMPTVEAPSKARIPDTEIEKLLRRSLKKRKG